MFVVIHDRDTGVERVTRLCGKAEGKRDAMAIAREVEAQAGDVVLVAKIVEVFDAETTVRLKPRPAPPATGEGAGKEDDAG